MHPVTPVRRHRRLRNPHRLRHRRLPQTFNVSVERSAMEVPKPGDAGEVVCGPIRTHWQCNGTTGGWGASGSVCTCPPTKSSMCRWNNLRWKIRNRQRRQTICGTGPIRSIGRAMEQRGDGARTSCTCPTPTNFLSLERLCGCIPDNANCSAATLPVARTPTAAVFPSVLYPVQHRCARLPDGKLSGLLQRSHLRHALRRHLCSLNSLSCGATRVAYPFKENPAGPHLRWR